MKQQKMLAYFDVLPLCDVVKDPSWIKALRAFVAAVENNQDYPQPPVDLVTALYQSLQPLQKVLVLHGLRTLVRENFEDDIESDDFNFRNSPYEDILGRHFSSSAQSSTDDQLPEKALTISERWVPQIAYFIVDRLIEIEVDGQLVALIKPGALRQHHDSFLFEFCKKMKTVLSLPEVIDNLFLPSYECQVPFAHLKPRQPLTKESEFVVSSRGNKGPRFMHIPLRDNLNAEHSIIDGGMQIYLNAPTNISATELKVRRTVLLLFVCLLNCRDLKNDGIIATTIVDCEDFLEFKYSSDANLEFPKIHVPFTEALLLEELDVELFRNIQLKIQQVDWRQLEIWVSKFIFQISKTATHKISYVLDERKYYQDPKPDYDGNRLISKAQFRVLKNNFDAVNVALGTLIQQQQITVHQLLKTFDPVWADWRDRYVACLAAANNERMMVLYFTREQKQKILEIVRFFSDEMTAHDLVGALPSRPPSPIVEAWRNHSSPLFFNRESTSSEELGDRIALVHSH